MKIECSCRRREMHDVLGLRWVEIVALATLGVAGPGAFGDDCNGNGLDDCGEIADGAPDVDGDGVLDACETARGDLNLDGTVDAADLAMLLAGWGPQATEPCAISIPEWATLVEADADPEVVTDAELRAAIAATGLPWRVRDTDTDVEFVLIPPGSFQMGCSPSAGGACGNDEFPVRTVAISQPFYLSRTEITQATWLQLTGNNIAFHQYDADSPDRPVERSRWQDAVDALSSAGMRLPTEAEWEYAYRAGTTSAFHGTAANPDGSDTAVGLAEIAWSSANAGGETHAVAQKDANGFGLFDMSGNVWEWCADWYGATYYSEGEAIDPAGPRTGTSRVARGGAWSIGSCRASDRQAFGPGVYRIDLGVRAARTP